MKKRALISVFYKDGVLELAHYLLDNGWEILSTGGTYRHLTTNGIRVTDVSSVTGFPECLDGRVKTLHPMIHAGLLAVRGNPEHLKTINELSIPPIDLVCVNLYPFFEKVQAGLSYEETVEFIDIGGPTMLRSAAKNHQDVLVLTDVSDYAVVLDALKTAEQDTAAIPLALKRRLAGKVFNLTAAYDAAVSRFMLGEPGYPADNTDQTWPEFLSLPLRRHQSLRYGENGHQQAALYLTADTVGAFGGMEQLQGKELSYNNMRDLDIAWKAASAYDFFLNHLSADHPARGKNNRPVMCVALKHNTPCGAALGTSVLEAYTRTWRCDPVSIFGGIIGCNTVIDGVTATEMIKTFLEVIVAPDFTSDALEILATKKNLRLVKACVQPNNRTEILSVDGGVLIQERDNQLFAEWKVVTEHTIDPQDAAEMAFGMTIALFVKSNAIVAVCDGAAVGIAGGQVNRIWAAEQALQRAKLVTENPENGFSGNARVLVSDAFFPFADCVEMAHAYGIKAIVQPGGSMRDQESIEMANRLGIAMVFTGTRHFKH